MHVVSAALHSAGSARANSAFSRERGIRGLGRAAIGRELRPLTRRIRTDASGESNPNVAIILRFFGKEIDSNSRPAVMRAYA